MAGSIRLFVDAPLRAGADVAISSGQAHYLTAVMRSRTGAPLRLFNGRDGEWAARIAEIPLPGGRRGPARCVVESKLRPQPAEPDLWLVFALLKRTPTDLVVQKATELGVSELFPVLTARTGAERTNPARLRAIAVEAAEQSERLTVPALHPPQPLAALLARWPAERPLVVAVERTPAPAVPRLGGRPAGLLVGPEGGFTAGELDGLHRHKFVVAASLGPRILRAETAAIVGLALLQAEPICS